MFNFKRIKCIFIFIILLLLIIPYNSLAIVSPTKDFFVNDYAEILTNETKKEIIEKNKILQKNTGAQIVVVTLSNLEGGNIEDYATELFREFNIGDSVKDNGILLLCFPEDKLLTIEVGEGLKEIITDEEKQEIQNRYIMPYFVENRFDDGIENGFSVLLDKISPNINTLNKFSGTFIIIVIINAFILICICISRYKKLSLKINTFKIIYIIMLLFFTWGLTQSLKETFLLLVINIVIYLGVYFAQNSKED